MKSKESLRREMIKKRKDIDKKNGEAFCDIIRREKWYQNASVVMIYMPINGESDVTGLLTDDKIFLTPVTSGEDMYASRIGKMCVGAFGIKEPEDKEPFDKNAIDVVFVPGVVFDKKGNRIGYGKGYYDRFLKDMTALKAGVCHSFQMHDIDECEEHDVKMDMIITEAGVWSNVNTL